MAFNLIQSKASDTSTGTSVGINLSSIPTPGNALILVFGSNTGSTNFITGVSDNAAIGSNTYFREVSIADATSSASVEIWVAYNVEPAATTHTITYTFNNGGGSLEAAAVVQEWSGVAYSNPLDKTASAITVSPASTINSGTTATTTQANELIIVGVTQSTFGQTYTAGSGYSNLVQSGSGAYPAVIESKVVSSTGAQSGTVSSTNTPTAAGAIITLFAAGATTTSTSSTSSSTSISSTSSSISSTSSSTSTSFSSTSTTTVTDLGFIPRATIRQWGWK